MGKLTALSVKALWDPGGHGDGDGLYLQIAPSDTKSSVQRIVINEKRRDIGLGYYPTVSLGPGTYAGCHKPPRRLLRTGSPCGEADCLAVSANNPAPSVLTFPHLRRNSHLRNRVAPPHLEQPETRCTMHFNPRNLCLLGVGRQADRFHNRRRRTGSVDADMG